MAEYRLSQVARKLNVGKNTILDFLKEKGHEVDSNPNSKIPQEQYDMLAREFADSAHDKEEASELTIGGKTDNLVINAEKVKLTGKKMTDKMYFRHTFYPGGERLGAAIFNQAAARLFDQL